MAATVVLDQGYFQTLLRRAGAHAEDASSIVIPRNDYEELLRISREYANLRACLMQGGVPPEMLDSLAQGPPDAHTEHAAAHQYNGAGELDWYEKPAKRYVNISKAGCDPLMKMSSKPLHHGMAPSGGDLTPTRSPGQFFAFPGRTDKSRMISEAAEYEVDHQSNDDLGPWMQRIGHLKTAIKERHTLTIANLPRDATHKDVTSIIRGGRLVDIWLQRKDSTATVTFASGAGDYLLYSKRRPIVLKGKKIEVSWSERQFEIPGHLVSKIAHGVSRNLVIKGATSRVNEHRIREDMEHIHNLVILAVVTHGNDIFVSTNSINNAMFARTCMTSRKDYKGLRIEWYQDECAEPLPTIDPTAMPIKVTKPAKAQLAANMYDLLAAGDDECASDDEDATSYSSRGSGIDLKGRTGDSERVRGSSSTSSS